MTYRRWTSIILMITISFLLTASASPNPREDQQFIRFHVIANSDSQEDQAVKLKVRDKLLAEFGEELGQSHSLEESRLMIAERIEEIQGTAQQEVDKYLPGYHVQAMLGHFDFPTKAYGNLVLPAGNYEALRVVIGKGQGANWWCVMFPPLCFVDLSHGVAKDDVDDEKQSTSTNLASTSKDDTKIEYGFKILEWWNKIVGRF